MATDLPSGAELWHARAVFECRFGRFVCFTSLLAVGSCSERQGPPIPGPDGGGASQASGGGPPAAGGTRGGGGDGGGAECLSFAPPVARSRPDDGALNEASGLIVSRRKAGRLYAHNDSGDSARVFAVDESGASLGRIEVELGMPVDWEDAAGFTGEVEALLVLADIGDNAAERANVQLVVLREPEELSGAALSPQRVLDFRYPDRAHNAETLFVDPRDGRAYVVTKEVPAQTFSAALDGSEESFRREAELELPSGFLPTAGDLWLPESGATEAWLVVRSTRSARLFRSAAPGQFETTDCMVELASEGEAGEAIAFDEEGNLFTISEREHPLSFYERIR